MRFIKHIQWLLLILISSTVYAEKATIAVATNFLPTLKTLVTQFEQQSDHQIIVSSAATGILFNQIQHGAPFDILLAADSQHPQLLTKRGLAIENTRFTYATGQLALAFSMTTTLGSDLQPADKKQQFTDAIKNSSGKIAIANPELAPYGIAAQESLKSLNLWVSIQSQLVKGTNVAQSHQFVATGNAELAFVALANVITKNSTENSTPHTTQLNYWPVPSNWHSAIQQQAVLLQSATNNQAAIDFIAFLKTNYAEKIIQQHGYKTADTLSMSY